MKANCFPDTSQSNAPRVSPPGPKGGGNGGIPFGEGAVCIIAEMPEVNA